jgi:D-amino-acid dehydrogenase
VGRFLPGLDVLSIERQVSGLRPVTPDGLPIVGVPDGWENVCLALGSGRKGMLLGAALGSAAAAILTTGAIPAGIDACAPARWMGAT